MTTGLLLDVLAPVVGPVAWELTKRAFSAILNEAKTVSQAQENLNSQLPLSDLQKMSPMELQQYIFDLRRWSLQLFSGLDFYGDEFDKALDVIQSQISPFTENPQLLMKEYSNTISLVTGIKTQIDTIANYRAELENSFIELLRRDYPYLGEINESYIEARRILKETPKTLFEILSPEGKAARLTVDNALVALRNILAKQREQWAAEQAFENRIMELRVNSELLYKQVAQNKWKLDEEIQTQYQEARSILSLPFGELRSDTGSSALEKVNQLITDLQIAIYRGQQEDLARQREADERKRQQHEKKEQDIQFEVEQSKQLRRLLLLVGIYIVVPTVLFAISLGILIWSSRSTTPRVSLQLPFLGTPYSVILWSALGSIASMLYFVNTYSEEYFRTPWKMFRWAFTRPLIGIIMGTVVYLAISGGILITVGEFAPSNYAFLWLFAFVGGFSDRLQQAVIALIVGKIKFEQNEGSIDADDHK